MSQISDKLLQHLRSEYQQTGKKTFSIQDILSYLDNSEECSQAIDELFRHKMIAKSTYVNCFDLLKP